MDPGVYIPAPPGVDAYVEPFDGFDPSIGWHVERNKWYVVRIQWARWSQRERHASHRRQQPAEEAVDESLHD